MAANELKVLWKIACNKLEYPAIAYQLMNTWKEKRIGRTSNGNRCWEIS